MLRRAPVTVHCYAAFAAVVLLAAFIDAGPVPGVLFGVLFTGIVVAGLYRALGITWIVAVVWHGIGLVTWIATDDRLWIPALQGVHLALLVAPQTREFLRDSRPQSDAARRRRGFRLTGAVLAGVLLGLVGFSALRPDPIGGDLELVRSDRPGVRVLFVGNSFVGDNDMIGMLRRLGEEAPDTPSILAVRYSRRGSSLQDALDDERLTGLLASERWDFVVLQEHSQVIARPGAHLSQTLRPASSLARLVARSGAQVLLYVTPGYEGGDDDNVPDDTYDAMQDRVSRAYAELGATIPARLAPVGAAWAQALSQAPGLELWGPDGRRPSRMGSYLAACVFHALLTERHPADSAFTAGLNPKWAAWFQATARQAVAQTQR